MYMRFSMSENWLWLHSPRPQLCSCPESRADCSAFPLEYSPNLQKSLLMPCHGFCQRCASVLRAVRLYPGLWRLTVSRQPGRNPCIIACGTSSQSSHGSYAQTCADDLKDMFQLSVPSRKAEELALAALSSAVACLLLRG